MSVDISKEFENAASEMEKARQMLEDIRKEFRKDVDYISNNIGSGSKNDSYGINGTKGYSSGSSQFGGRSGNTSGYNGGSGNYGHNSFPYTRPDPYDPYISPDPYDPYTDPDPYTNPDPFARPSDDDKKKEDNSNPYGFDVTKITDDEDIIEDYIKQGLPVFLHGLSGCGKSSRVKEMDPDCKIIYLASATPETLIGKSAVINGVAQDIPPTWYTELCKRCEEDPDNIHIVFFDELTNASKNLMGYAYNIVLDREIDGKWKLPPNARIVAAGNEADESIAATKMPEPLFRRFNHVNVVTTLEKWLLWASKHDIHPAIYAFVASRGNDPDKQILRTKCDGKNNCVDPRKWEMASKMLKASNNPGKLKCIIGDQLTQEFIDFIKIDVITLSQVLNGEYQVDGRIEISKAARSLPGLAAVDEKNIKIVRDFVYKHMYPEQVKQFKIYWTRGDKERCRILDEFDIEDKLNGSQEKLTDEAKRVM